MEGCRKNMFKKKNKHSHGSGCFISSAAVKNITLYNF